MLTSQQCNVQRAFQSSCQWVGEYKHIHAYLCAHIHILHALWRREGDLPVLTSALGSWYVTHLSAPSHLLLDTVPVFCDSLGSLWLCPQPVYVFMFFFC